MEQVSIFWHRRDLRYQDNVGLYYALDSEQSVLPIFIFDSNILDNLEDKKDARVSFIYDQLKEIDQVYRNNGSGLLHFVFIYRDNRYTLFSVPFFFNLCFLI